MQDKINKQDREWMIKYWANYIRTHSDKDWSRQQNELIDFLIDSNFRRLSKHL